jgi:Asp-tRNA(Asn)/Glu-tRNA(Gln) amidotransferase A subunit family amidase
MTDARSAAECGAGVLELLRLFGNDSAAADQYAAVCLDRATQLEPALRAFEYLPRDIVRRPGPLSGIPVAIKDIIATSNMPTTNGSPVYRDHVPAADAWVAERLRNLGATIFGKTVSTEFAWVAKWVEGVLKFDPGLPRI